MKVILYEANITFPSHIIFAILYVSQYNGNVLMNLISDNTMCFLPLLIIISTLMSKTCKYCTIIKKKK